MARVPCFIHGWAQIFARSRRAAPRRAARAGPCADMFLACPNGVYMDYPRNAGCTRVPLSAACLSTQCDKRGHAQKLWRAARTANLRRAFHPRDGWGGIVQIHPGMTEGMRRAGYPARMLYTVRNPAQA